jgi:CheY-specific phosphatase CheX
MNNSAEKTLYRKAALIFEELGFLMPRPDNGADIETCNGSTAIVFFRGPFSGYLQVSLNSDLLVQLAANMLGDENSSIQEYERDSLREIANVICGNALPAIFGFEPIFHLDAPQIFEASSGPVLDGNFKNVAKTHILFDSGYAEVSLYADQNTPDAIA